MASFGPSRKVSDGNSMLDHPKGATMPNIRFAVSAIVAVGLLAGACGGDEGTTPAGEVETTSSEVEALSPDAPSVGEEAVEPEPEAIPAEPVPLTVGQVELGDRFPWCAKVNAIWQNFDEAADLQDIMTASLHEAQQAAATATDELDVIEARNAEQLAQQAYDEVLETYDDAYANFSNYLLATRLYLVFPSFSSTAATHIESMVRQDQEFFAAYYSRTPEEIDADVATRMSHYHETLDAETGAMAFSWYRRYRSDSDPWEESELVAIDRAWQAFDTVVGDVPAFDMFRVNVGLIHALSVYSLTHGKHVDSYLEQNRPANQIRFALRAELEPKAEQAEQAIIDMFINNHEARAAYQKSYQESCQP